MKTAKLEGKKTGLVQPFWVFLLIGCVFSFFGLIALVGLVKRANAGPIDGMSLSKLVGPLIVLGTFGTIGFLFIALVIYVTRELRRENALRLQYPAEPWKHRRDWAEQRSRHHLVGRACALLGIAIAVNSMVVGIMLSIAIAPAAAPAQANPVALQICLSGFLIIAFGFGLYAVWLVRDAIRLRTLCCDLIAPPFVTGGIVRCLVRWPAQVVPTVPVRVTLTCSATRHVRQKLLDKEVGEQESYQFTYFESQYAIQPTLRSLGDDTTLVPIRFAIPDSLPTTDQLTSGGWSLQLNWPSRLGWQHEIEFDLPVFARDPESAMASDECVAFDEKYLGDGHSVFPVSSTRVTLDELVQQFGGAFEQTAPENWSLAIPRAGQKRLFVLFGYTACALVFTGAGLAMGSLWGLAFLLMPWAAFYHGSGQHRLRCDGENIECEQPLAWSRRTQCIPLASIQQVTCLQSDQFIDQRPGLHQVIAETHSHESVVLLANAQSPLLARRVSQLIKNQFMKKPR